MTLAPDFTCDYDSQIAVSAGTNVTIHGNGAVLDAAQKRGVHRGRFFNVDSGSGGTLAGRPERPGGHGGARGFFSFD
jgi:hypothetical protein